MNCKTTRKIKSAILSLLSVFVLFSSCSTDTPPKPYGALPTERQLQWHQLERYCFLHFSVNTFTGREWGDGSEDPNLFNPSDFDAEQIVSTLAKTGFRGAILTCKHHDGFCLWPTSTTEHSVKNISWRNGEGDVVREISEACKKYGIKFGVYLSPWDRNSAFYGTEEYISLYREQLTELLSHYGEIFEVWFDGANGGTGYYGGANEERRIDRATYYDWENTFTLVRELQPNACIFSDIGPDIRWCGNESGYVQDSCWASYLPRGNDGKAAGIGQTDYKRGETGTLNEGSWMPAEVDVSIRPGWFYHESEDSLVRTLKKRVGKHGSKEVFNLKENYFNSVGSNASWNLNIPPDGRGKIHPVDSMALEELSAFIKASFSENLLRDARVKASDTRGRGKQFSPQNVLDENIETFWAANDENTSASLSFSLNEATVFNCVEIKEYIPLGQRITSFSIEVKRDGQWEQVYNGSTVGYKKLVEFDTVESAEIRINFRNSLACPVIESVGLYKVVI